MHEEIKRLFDLGGKVSLIVGGARDFGFDMACVVAAAASDLVITSRSYENAQASAAKLKDKFDVDVLGFQLDHTDANQLRDVVDRISRCKKRIDILINNAGGGAGEAPSRLFEKSPDRVADLIKRNLTGTLYCCREVGKIMAQQKYGKIVNIASIAGVVGRDRRMYDRSNLDGQSIDYAAAKAGVIGMTRDLAAYLSPMGVYVNCISPGGFNRGLPEKFVKDYSDRTPLGRMGRDGIDLRGAVLFLCSPASDYVTGHNLVVDGGFSIWQ